MVKLAIYKAKANAGGKQRERHGRKHGHSEKFHCIVKRRSGLCEGYDERKVYGSVYAACYVVRLSEPECELVANTVAKSVTRHVHSKKEVTSADLHHLVVKELRKRNQDAAFMYDTHRDLA